MYAISGSLFRRIDSCALAFLYVCRCWRCSRFSCSLLAAAPNGNAPPLGKSGHASLTSPGSDVALASVALAPLGALRVTVYYRGKLVPTTGAQTPAELRENGCLGPLVAPISDGNPVLGAGTPGTTGTPTPGAGTPLADYAADPAGGMDVSFAPGANLYVVVYSQRNDPAAHILACGDPLSGQNQFFDLYPPQVLGAGSRPGNGAHDSDRRHPSDLHDRSYGASTHNLGGT